MTSYERQAMSDEKDLSIGPGADSLQRPQTDDSEHGPLGWAMDRTPARVFVDRCGPAYRTQTQLQLRADHACALDAVQDEIDLSRDFATEFMSSRRLFAIQSRATDKREFLLRPDLGRQLNDEAKDAISRLCPYGPAVQIVLGDGLSAAAVVHQVPTLLPCLEEAIRRRGLRLGQTFLVRYCRVGIMNEIGDLLNPEVIVLLIGERPGLASAESLSAYLAYRPQSGQTDAQRNLVSNIHSRGVPATDAAGRVAALIDQMREQRASGIAIKEQLEVLNEAPPWGALNDGSGSGERPADPS